MLDGCFTVQEQLGGGIRKKCQLVQLSNGQIVDCNHMTREGMCPRGLTFGRILKDPRFCFRTVYREIQNNGAVLKTMLGCEFYDSGLLNSCITSGNGTGKFVESVSGNCNLIHSVGI